MVRVISVHHFAGQHVQTVEQPTASAIAPPHRLLLALSSHCIEVRDLKNEGDVLFTFPTVDEVTQLIHCLNGDYVATIETKYNHQNKDINFVRVYVNWDSVATLQQSKMTNSGVSLGSSECGMVQPMRARIAGRVTPTTNQSELGSLEMIEIPTRANPNSIECCQVSGNIIILSNKTLTVYAFKVKTHDISKLRFVDFEESPIGVELCFAPNEVAICENYIACINADSMHMFKIVTRDNSDKESHNDDDDITFKYVNPDAKIDYKQLLRYESNKEKVTVHLPMIVKNNSAIHRHSPFTFTDKEMNAQIISSSPIDNPSHAFQIHNLIQLKLVPIVIENAQRRVAEQFKCVVVKPVYVDQALNNKLVGDRRGNKLLQSDYRDCLNSVVCMIATQQEGYLYQFNDSDAANVTDNCISMYPFTAPVQKILIEDCFLHALTEAGLETYTLRIGHQLCKGLENVQDNDKACPPVSDSICLVGLRPFLGIEKILLCETNLVLLANADSSPTHSVGSNSSSNASFWTLYNLELPTPKTIFNDISIVANVHRFTSAQTYCHLMSEAHMILRTILLLLKWKTIEGNVTLIAPAKDTAEDVIETYQTSCALLGDHFIMCTTDDYVLALPYYKMARLTPLDVIKRVKKLQEQSNSHAIKGLLYYIKRILLETKPGSHTDKTFGATSKQHFAEAILELFEKHDYKELPTLILKSNILREYSTEKLINILCAQASETEDVERALALSILYVQRCNTTKAQSLIADMKTQDLFDVLLENWELLFETTTNIQNKHKNTTFSDLAQILMTTNSDVLSQLLITLMLDKKTLTLSKFLKIFLEYLPSSIGSDANTASVVLQKTLETYFKRYFANNEHCDLKSACYDRPIQEALKLLVRSYLSQLQLQQLKENNQGEDDNKKSVDTTKKIVDVDDNDSSKECQQEKFKYNQTNKTYFEETSKKAPAEDYLFSHLRFEYLNKMPPFQVEITSKFYETCQQKQNCDKKTRRFRPNEEADLVLKKLQALLCGEVLPKQVVAEIGAFLNLDGGLRGNESLQSIVMGTNEAVLFLVDVCPQCLLQYGKDRFTKLEEWKLLIATIQQRIILLSQDDNLKRVCFFYKKILKDVLTHVATTMNLEHLVQVFPQRLNTGDDLTNQQNTHNRGTDDKIVADTDILDEIQNYEPYVVMCKETMHANQIKKLITATGQQLLCTLNL